MSFDHVRRAIYKYSGEPSRNPKHADQYTMTSPKRIYSTEHDGAGVRHDTATEPADADMPPSLRSRGGYTDGDEVLHPRHHSKRGRR